MDNREIVQWLFSLDANININNEDPLRCRCFGSHTEIAQWLYMKDIDVHVSNQRPFSIAVKK